MSFHTLGWGGFLTSQCIMCLIDSIYFINFDYLMFVYAGVSFADAAYLCFGSTIKFLQILSYRIRYLLMY